MNSAATRRAFPPDSQFCLHTSLNANYTSLRPDCSSGTYLNPAPPPPPHLACGTVPLSINNSLALLHPAAPQARLCTQVTLPGGPVDEPWNHINSTSSAKKSELCKFGSTLGLKGQKNPQVISPLFCFRLLATSCFFFLAPQRQTGQSFGVVIVIIMQSLTVNPVPLCMAAAASTCERR